MDLMEAIKGRRSIRKYKPDAVSDETLHTLMEAVRCAPSWANTQCWEIVVVKDQKMKSELATAVSKMNPANAAMIDAPVVLVLCGKKEVAGFFGGKAATVRGDWLMFDVGLAMQNLCLAAYSLGLGTVVVGMFDHKKVEEILGVPENVAVVAMTPLGVPSAGGNPPKRKETSTFVHQNKF